MKNMDPTPKFGKVVYFTIFRLKNDGFIFDFDYMVGVRDN